jgi:hypothetical protein
VHDDMDICCDRHFTMLQKCMFPCIKSSAIGIGGHPRDFDRQEDGAAHDLKKQ